jgi:hypothetical protein
MGNQKRTIKRNWPYREHKTKKYKTKTHNTQHANKHKQRNALIQTTVAIDHPNIISMRKSRRTSQHGTQNVKTHNRITHKNIMMSNTDPTKNRGRTHLCYHFSVIIHRWNWRWINFCYMMTSVPQYTHLLYKYHVGQHFFVTWFICIHKGYNGNFKLKR